MEWQAVVLVMQILMLAVGWFLFQQAKGELSARAAETPVLGEVKALQRSIKQLLTDLDQTSERTSRNLETKCQQARELANELSDRLQELHEIQDHALSLRETQISALLPPLTIVTEQMMSTGQRETLATRAEAPTHMDRAVALSADVPAIASSREKRRDHIFALADAGQPSSAIARETGISEGEIETLLGLRVQRA